MPDELIPGINLRHQPQVLFWSLAFRARQKQLLLIISPFKNNTSCSIKQQQILVCMCDCQREIDVCVCLSNSNATSCFPFLVLRWINWWAATTPPWAIWMISRPFVISLGKWWLIVPLPLISDSYPLMSGSSLVYLSCPSVANPAVGVD